MTLMKTLTGLLPCVVLTTVSLYAQPQSLEEVRRYEGKMANPKEVTVTEEGHALLLDPGRPQAALTLVDLENRQEVARVARGNGPGLIRTEGNHVLTQGEERTFWVWQRDGKQLSIFDRELQHRASRTLSEAGDGLFPLNDSTALVVPSLSTENTLFEYRRIADGRRIADAADQKVSTDVHSLFSPLEENPMLRQGHYVVDQGEAVIAFRFSSALVQLDDEGVRRVVGGEDVIPFPDYDFRSDKGDQRSYQAPDVTEHPIATMDLAVDDRYIYVLHHGETFDVGTLSRFTKAVRGRMEAAIEEWELTERVLIYDRASLKFVRELTLPHGARAIDVDENYLYVLTTDDMPPTLFTYQKPNVE